MRRDWIAPCAVTLLAGALRFIGLGDQCFWGDELCSINVTKFPLASSLAYYSTDPHPPLFYISVRLMRQFGESETWLRAIPALWGTLAVLVLYLAVRQLHGTRAALIAALVLALNPLHNWISQDLRNLSMLTTLGALSVLLLIPIARGRRDRLSPAHALVTAAALYTNYFAFFIVAFQGLYLLWSRRSLRQLKHIAVPLLLFAPWTLFLVSQFIHGQSWREFTSLGQMLLQTWLAWTFNSFPWRPSTLSGLLEPLLARSGPNYGLVQLALSAPALLLVGWSLVRRKDRGNRLFAAYLLLPFALVLAVSLFVPLFSAKYMVFVVPAFAACVGLGFDAAWERSRILAGACLAALLLCGALGIAQTRNDPLYSKPQWREAFSAMASRTGPRDLLLVFSRHSTPDLLYYYRGDAPLKQIILDSSRLTVPDDSDELHLRLEKLIAERDTVWLADYMGYLHDPQRSVERQLDQRLERGEPISVQPYMGIRFIPYSSPQSADEATLP
ncbi:MAG: glycosyltransferase family 39 protein [Candidatus Alcyoniella australis]|nr:glycosyltransferase family 39 protein [Candidatus Alcyoniella australis]